MGLKMFLLSWEEILVLLVWMIFNDGIFPWFISHSKDKQVLFKFSQSEFFHAHNGFYVWFYEWKEINDTSPQDRVKISVIQRKNQMILGHKS